MSEKLLTCAECDELLLDYFEGELDRARRGAVEAHASTCARCHSLIQDVNGIRSEAANLPELAPSRDLWQGIESRIQPAVVPIAARRTVHLSHRLIGIAAAALVVVSSSITYVVSKPSGPTKPRRVVEQPRDIPVPGASDEIPSGEQMPAAVSEPAADPDAETPSQETERSTPSRTPRVRQPSIGGGTSPGPRGTSLASTAAPRTAAESSLAPEIEQLQDMLQQRRKQLDPSTVKIVEDNLALIDAAVKQARAALQRDPASGFLTERLDEALQKKVELLRTAALLPSRS
jgi:hypothetical protein